MIVLSETDVQYSIRDQHLQIYTANSAPFYNEFDFDNGPLADRIGSGNKSLVKLVPYNDNYHYNDDCN